jgi:hypothetical protein
VSLTVFLLAGCGLSEPDNLAAVLSVDEVEDEEQLSVTLFGPGEVSGCSVSPFLEFDQLIERDRVLVEVRGHDSIPDDPGTCTEVIDITGRVELPALALGETLRLEVVLQDKVNAFEIQREERGLVIVTVAEGNVTLSCDPNSLVECLP